jgi:alanine racemase
MNRLGLSVKEATELALRTDVLERLNLSLLVSHLSCPDTPDHPANAAQLSLFRSVRERYASVPASFANSAGIYLGRDFHFDIVRPGIALYGAEFTAGKPPLRIVATHAARILQIRQGAIGETVGYGGRHQLKRGSRIAIISAGYADGYHRFAGSSDDRTGANVVIRGRPAPILGRVSMDLIATDVTDIPEAAPGDFAELFGPNMAVDRVAVAAGTIGYELLTGVSRRAKRVYLNAPPKAV